MRRERKKRNESDDVFCVKWFHKIKQQLSYPSNLQDKHLFDHISPEPPTRIYEFYKIGIEVRIVFVFVWEISVKKGPMTR